MIAAYILEIRGTIIALILENVMLLDNMHEGLLVLKANHDKGDDDDESSEVPQFVNKSAVSLLK